MPQFLKDAVLILEAESRLAEAGLGAMEPPEHLHGDPVGVWGWSHDLIAQKMRAMETKR